MDKLFKSIKKNLLIIFSVACLILFNQERVFAVYDVVSAKTIKNENDDELATSFMEFLEDVAPQYRENVLKASEYIENKLETEE